MSFIQNDCIWGGRYLKVCFGYLENHFRGTISSASNECQWFVAWVWKTNVCVGKNCHFNLKSVHIRNVVTVFVLNCPFSTSSSRLQCRWRQLPCAHSGGSSLGRSAYSSVAGLLYWSQAPSCWIWAILETCILIDYIKIHAHNKIFFLFSFEIFCEDSKTLSLKLVPAFWDHSLLVKTVNRTA